MIHRIYRRKSATGQVDSQVMNNDKLSSPENGDRGWSRTRCYTYLRGCSGGGALERAPHGHNWVTHIIYASGIIHFSQDRTELLRQSQTPGIRESSGKEFQYVG